MSTNDKFTLGVFQETLFQNTLLNAIYSVIDTILSEENDGEFREKLKSRFLSVIENTNEFSTGEACEGDTEDDKFPYYYAVVDAKSFGKYLIPTYKPVIYRGGLPLSSLSKGSA